MYDLIELIIKASFWTKDYSTFDTHTQHTSLLFNECLFYLCDCTCSNVMFMFNCLSIKPKNIFEYFICFWKCFYAFMFWVFVQIAFCMFFIKNFLRGIFTRRSWLTSSCENGLRQNSENTIFKQKLSRLSRNCFASKVYPAQSFVLQMHFSQVTLWEGNQRKTRVFSFKGLM